MVERQLRDARPRGLAHLMPFYQRGQAGIHTRLVQVAVCRRERGLRENCPRAAKELAFDPLPQVRADGSHGLSGRPHPRVGRHHD